MSGKEIEGFFTEEELQGILRKKNTTTTTANLTTPKHLILPHKGFEKLLLPTGQEVKLAYKKLYPLNVSDFEIELAQIAKCEHFLKNPKLRKKALLRLKYHYKQAVSLASPKLAQGWNRWSDNILDLFISDRKYKVLWGSGNCGKSQVMAVLLYIKWRVNPGERKIILASRVLKEAQTRVFSYIKELHLKAPEPSGERIIIKDSSDQKGIYHALTDEKGKLLPNYRGCIESLPIKVSAATDEIGANLLGHHPGDFIIVAFDEAQELPAKLLESRIFANWNTNENMEVYAWGNPMPVDINAQEEHDVLFRLGSKGLSLQSLKDKEKNAESTSSWAFGETAVLHIAMTDSPKDDPDERTYYLDRGDGVKQQRLHFLAGKENAENIATTVSKDSPTWYSQVLGFPYLHTLHSKNASVVTPFMVRESAKYPLIWLKQSWDYYMGVDPAASGKNDAASIIAVRTGTMEDARHGVDAMNGEYHRQVDLIDGEEFADSVIESMWSIAQKLNIPLRNIAIDTHGVGEVIRYALQRHIEGGKWKSQYDRGQMYHVVSPMIGATERPLFKLLGHMVPAQDMVGNVITEYWVAVRCMILSRQLFNVPEVILQQFYNRYLFTKGAGNKYKVETKEEMKKRGLYSPNDADALCNAIDLIRYRGFKYRFYNRGSYVASMGESYMSTRKEREAQKVMLNIADILGVGDNLRKYKKQETLILRHADTLGKGRGERGFVDIKQGYGSSLEFDGPNRTSGDGMFGLRDDIRKKKRKKSGIDVI